MAASSRGLVVLWFDSVLLSKDGEDDSKVDAADTFCSFLLGSAGKSIVDDEATSWIANSTCLLFMPLVPASFKSFFFSALIPEGEEGLEEGLGLKIFVIQSILLLDPRKMLRKMNKTPF